MAVEVVNPAGEITPDAEPWFESSSDKDAVIVAVLGPQSSGKSTLCNALFGTDFPVAGRTSLATATTRGILAGKPADASKDNFVVLDVEGADARERGRSGKSFQVRCASFVANLADAIVLNMWYHDTCRVDSSSYELLRTVLHTCAQAIHDGSSGKTALVFAIRDVEDEVDQDNLKQVVTDDVSFHTFARFLCTYNLEMLTLVYLHLHNADERNMVGSLDSSRSPPWWYYVG